MFTPKKTTSWLRTFNGGSKLRFILSLINITSISTAITPHHDCHSETRSVKSSFPACPHPAWQPQPSTGCIPQCIVILGYPAEHRALLCSVLHKWNSASIFIKSYLQCAQLALHRTCAVCTKSSFQDRIASHRTALCMHSLHCTNLHLKIGHAPVHHITLHLTLHHISPQYIASRRSVGACGVPEYSGTSSTPAPPLQCSSVLLDSTL